MKRPPAYYSLFLVLIEVEWFFPTSKCWENRPIYDIFTLYLIKTVLLHFLRFVSSDHTIFRVCLFVYFFIFLYFTVLFVFLYPSFPFLPPTICLTSRLLSLLFRGEFLLWYHPDIIKSTWSSLHCHILFYFMAAASPDNALDQLFGEGEVQHVVDIRQFFHFSESDILGKWDSTPTERKRKERKGSTEGDLLTVLLSRGQFAVVYRCRKAQELVDDEVPDEAAIRIVSLSKYHVSLIQHSPIVGDSWLYVFPIVLPYCCAGMKPFLYFRSCCNNTYSRRLITYTSLSYTEYTLTKTTCIL